MKKLMIIAAFFLLGASTIMIAACQESSQDRGEKNTVHMSDVDFEQASITIDKGGSLTLINDSSVLHILQNGVWENGTSQQKIESGAPSINVTINSNSSQSIGPFNAPGTFHLYCTVHAGMNLTVVVQ